MRSLDEARQDAGLQELVGRLDRWRRWRRRRERMPVMLWDAAVEVAERLGVSAVARAAGLSYYGLKTRLREAEAAATARRPRFVELTVPQVEAHGARGREIELQRPDGVRLTIRQPGSADIAAVLSALLGRHA